MLGAGFMQSPAIIEAKKLGCTVIAVDGNPNAAAVKLADWFEPIDLKDIPALTAFALKLKKDGGLDAVFTAATDFSVSVAAAAEACGLPGHSLEAAKNATDKVRMRGCFLRAGVPSPRFAEFKAADICNEQDMLKRLPFSLPAVVKPADNMGARGCRLVLKAEDFVPALTEAVKFSRSGTAVAEEFIGGEEFSLEGLVFDGRLFVTAAADRHIFFPPYFVEMGHTIPSRFGGEYTEKLIEVFSQGVKALGLTHGAVKGDIFLKAAGKDGKRRAFAGEIAARLSGGYMSGWTVPYSSGINITRAALRLALGENPMEELCADGVSFETPLNRNAKNFSAERAWISIPGKAAEIYGLEAASKVRFVKEVFPRVEAGGEVRFPKNNVEKCGNVLSSAPSYEKAVQSAETAIRKIVIRLKAPDKETSDFLNSVNDCLENQTEYPPNFFIFPVFTGKKIPQLLYSCSFEEEDGIIFPAFFKPFLDSVREPHGKTLRFALEETFRLEPGLLPCLKAFSLRRDSAASAALCGFWTAFIRGGTQGALYMYDNALFK